MRPDIHQQAPPALNAAPNRYAHSQLNESALWARGAVKSGAIRAPEPIFAKLRSRLCHPGNIGPSLVKGPWGMEPDRYLGCLCMEGSSPDRPGS